MMNKTHTLTLLAAGTLLAASAAQAQVVYDESWATDQDVSAYTDWSSDVKDIGEGLNNMPEPSVSSGIASSSSGSSGDGLAYSYFATGNFTLASGNETIWTVSDMGILQGSGGRDWTDGAPENGAMVWLGGTSTDLTSGDGYFAGTANNNVIGIYRYNGGFDGTVTKILTGTYQPDLTIYDMEVSFDGTDTWSLSAVDAGGTLASQGTIVDTTYTSDTFVGSGFGFSAFTAGSKAGRGGQAGDVSMAVIPEPSAFALMLGGLGLGLVLVRRRR